MVQIKNKEELKKTNDPKLLADFADVEDNNQKLKISIEESKKVTKEQSQGVQPQQSEADSEVKNFAGNDTHSGDQDLPTQNKGTSGDAKQNVTETKKTAEIGKKSDQKANK